MLDIKVGETYLYLKEACSVKVIKDLGEDKDYLGHNLFKVKANEPCEALNIKAGDEFTALDSELDW